MADVIRLVTVVDVQDRPSPSDFRVADGSWAPVGWAPASPNPHPADPRVMSLSALHLAVLDDGRRLILLDDRGWTERGPSDIWRHTSLEAIAATARTVVGPDEPFGDYTAEDMETSHWEYLVGIVHQQGVQIEAREMSRLRHDVRLTERLRNRLTGR